MQSDDGNNKLHNAHASAAAADDDDDVAAELTAAGKRHSNQRRAGNACQAIMQITPVVERRGDDSKIGGHARILV